MRIGDARNRCCSDNRENGDRPAPRTRRDGRFTRVGHNRDIGNQSVSAAGDILDVPRFGAGIAKRGAKLPDAEVQAGVETDVRIGPELRTNLLAREDGAPAAGEQRQQPRRLRRQPFGCRSAAAAHVAASRVELEFAEAIPICHAVRVCLDQRRGSVVLACFCVISGFHQGSDCLLR
jgi:hypothetical protein